MDDELIQDPGFRAELEVAGGGRVAARVLTSDRGISTVGFTGNFTITPATAGLALSYGLIDVSTNAYTEAVQERLDAALEEFNRRNATTAQLTGCTTRDLAQVVRRALSQAKNFRDLDWGIMWTAPMTTVLNVALDEVLLNQVNNGQRGPTLRFWEWNDTAAVIGSFQSYVNEVDEGGIEKHNVQVVRRISGGGTMFMEGGQCITYSLYVPDTLVAGLSHIDSYEFLDRWVVTALNELGVECWYLPINDITSHAGKLAGAAQKRRGHTVLHHTTMSYEMHTAKMRDVLRTGKPKIMDKGLPSANKKVDSLRHHTDLSRADIITALKQTFITRYGGTEVKLDADTLAAARELVDTKYSTEAWTKRVP